MIDIFDFFENYDMPVLAADLNSGETIYMNKSAASCAVCSINLTEAEKAALVPERFLHRSFFSKPLGRTVEAETTLIISNGKTLVFEIQSTSSSWAESAFCTSMQEEDPCRTPLVMLKKAGAVLNAEKMYICEKNDPDRFTCSCECTCECCAHTQELSQEASAYLYNIFPETDCIVIDDINAPEAADKQLCGILSKCDIHSFAAAPIFEGEAMTGICCAENFPENMQKNAAEILRRTTFFLGICIKWSRLFSDLKKMSLTDRLTGIGNRHAMDILEASLKTSLPLGLVFCDISGLKRINDTLGHCAGDEYIINACNIMKKLFCREELFRIGGDELLAVLMNTNEAEVLEKEAALKSELEAASIAMAVGSSFGTADSSGMNKLLLEAETKMYKDKTAYYIRTGRERRRY